MLVQWAI